MSKTVQLFVTCIVDALFPETGEAVVRVLQRAGCSVGFPPGQTCCGQPAFNAGMRPQAAQMAKNTITAFENTPGDIVIPSGSCAGMVRHGYRELFADDPEWLQRSQFLAERTFEFAEYLVDELGIDNVGAKTSDNITYHPSCHLLRDLGIDRQPQQLLENVEGATIFPLQKMEECCGFGGLFSIEHPEISKEMLDRKIENFTGSGASVLVSCDAGCIAHISGGLERRQSSLKAVHIANFLDQQ